MGVPPPARLYSPGRAGSGRVPTGLSVPGGKVSRRAAPFHRAPGGRAGVWYVGTVPGQGLGPLQVAWGIVWFLLLGFQRRGTWA